MPGTDALGWDRPFTVMRRAFRDSGDAREIWDAHFAGRDREVFIVQQLGRVLILASLIPYACPCPCPYAIPWCVALGKKLDRRHECDL